MTDTMSRREAAEYLGVRYNTVRGYEERGLLKARKVTVGGIEEVRYPRADVVSILSSGIVPRYKRGNPRPSLASEDRALEAERQRTAEMRAQVAAYEATITELRDRVKSLEKTMNDILKVAR
jgi:DNA-binding transcriptional MerR regulator